MKRQEPINVTKTFLPPKQEYEKYVDQIWQNNQLTNNGPLSKEFEQKVSDYLGIKASNFRFVANGTLALQLALKALDINDGEVITTPFSYVATTSAILWQGCTPVFVDIDPESLNIDPIKIEAAITPKTRAILAVHVFGNPCNVEAIQKIADKHNLKVIYDAAHAFGVKYKSESLLLHGDISILSFHATKLFHTIEGGGVYTKDKSIIEKIELIKRFGHNGYEHYMLGINAKASEFQAAMGLCNLKYIDKVITGRKKATKQYDNLLQGKVAQQKRNSYTDYNYSYYPVIFSTETSLVEAKAKLEQNNIYPRRYFYPSLNKLPYISNSRHCVNSEDISHRILCLPLYDDINSELITLIAEAIV